MDPNRGKLGNQDSNLGNQGKWCTARSRKNLALLQHNSRVGPQPRSGHMDTIHDELKAVRELLAQTQQQLAAAKFEISVLRCVELDYRDEVFELKEELWLYRDRERKAEEIANYYLTFSNSESERGVE